MQEKRKYLIFLAKMECCDLKKKRHPFFVGIESDKHAGAPFEDVSRNIPAEIPCAFLAIFEKEEKMSRYVYSRIKNAEGDEHSQHPKHKVHHYFSVLF